MTWWGAVGLALALYGVVVLLEWLYEKILVGHGHVNPGISVVIRFHDEADRVEHVARELRRLASQGIGPFDAWEVLWVTRGAGPETKAIVERLCRHYPTFHLMDADDAVVLSRCQYPLIVWMDLSRDADGRQLLEAVRRMLTSFTRP